MGLRKARTHRHQLHVIYTFIFWRPIKTHEWCRCMCLTRSSQQCSFFFYQIPQNYFMTCFLSMCSLWLFTYFYNMWASKYKLYLQNSRVNHRQRHEWFVSKWDWKRPLWPPFSIPAYVQMSGKCLLLTSMQSFQFTAQVIHFHRPDDVVCDLWKEEESTEMNSRCTYLLCCGILRPGTMQNCIS